MTNKRIIFVPGKNPKPEPALHRQLLWRSLREGIKRADPGLNNLADLDINVFTLVAWNYLYYHHYRDPARDLPWIDALLNRHGPSEEDIKLALGWHTRLTRFSYRVADRLPFIISALPKVIRATVLETQRYFENSNNIACRIRETLKNELRPLLTDSAPILLIGHSLGSVIAYDALWELSQIEKLPGKIDLFFTLGSPLGMHYVQHRLQGYREKGAQRYPLNIRRWSNLSAVGDLTALDQHICNAFQAMLDLGLVDSIEDHCDGIFNFFHNEEGLNCHRSYGYLVNPAVGKIIADWWRRTV
jgi:hypothetical protein